MIYVNARFLTQKISGVQRFAQEISKTLKKVADFEIVFLAPKGVIHKELAKELEVQHIGMTSGYFWEQVELPLYLKIRGGGTLLNLCNVSPLLYKEKITVVHDVAFLKNPSWFSKKVRIVYGTLLPRVIKSSRAIITVSEFSKREIEKYTNYEGEIHVVNNAVSDFFHPVEEKSSFILTVGSMDPRKNFDKLIQSVRYLKSQEELVIIGSSSKIFGKGGVPSKKGTKLTFTGYVDDKQLRKYYQEASCFVYPSVYEGFGIPPLEAMRCGTPCVVSDIEVFREIFEDSCLYANPDDPEDFAEKIDLILQDKELRWGLSEKGKACAGKYSWQNSTAKLIQIIKNFDKA